MHCVSVDLLKNHWAYLHTSKGTYIKYAGEGEGEEFYKFVKKMS